MRRLPITSLRLLALLAGVLLTACGEAEPLRIGFLGGLSGRVADLGVAGRNAATLAIEQRNAAGGVGGRRVELLARDDHQDAEAARSAMRELIAAQVAAVVGPMTSSMAVAVVPLANEARVLMISPTVTTTELSEKDDYFLRIASTTREYAGRSARHLTEGRGIRRVAAIYDLGNRAYTEAWLKDFRAAFEAQGGEVARTLSFHSGPETRLQALVEQLLATPVDAVVIVANSLDTALLCQQIRKLDAKVHIAAAEWGSTERLTELGGAAVEGISMTQFVDRESRAPAYLAFRDAYLKRYGQEPGFAGVAAFDATNIVLDALATARPGTALKAAILAKGRFKGLQDEIVFDRNGDANRPIFLSTVRGGRFEAIR